MEVFGRRRIDLTVVQVGKAAMGEERMVHELFNVVAAQAQFRARKQSTW